MSAVLVTGGAGYIGRYVCAALRRGGFDAVAYDLRTAPGHAIVGDVLDLDALEAAVALERPSAIIHLAARSSVAESVAQPDLYRENAQMSANVAAVAGDLPVILASSAAVYGDQEEILAETRRCRPINPYGASKVASEAALPDATCLRLFNVAGGAGARPEQLLPRLMAALETGEPMTLNGGGNCIRDFVHVLDVTEAFVAALRHRLAGQAAEVLNICSGSAVAVREVANVCELTAGRRLVRVDAPAREGDPAWLVGDPARARKMLGWTATASLYAIVQSALKEPA